MKNLHRWILSTPVWILLIALGAHLFLSRYGLNPTDDGFTLAYARRLLDGQVPHRDFILIRPCLSPLMHVPEVWLGGDYAFYLSRLVVWLQFAFIAVAGVRVIGRRLGDCFSLLEERALALAAFALCVHTFPLIAWHSIDGLTLITAGLAIRVLASARWSPLAYLLFGAACLCKQSFVFFAPGALILFWDWKNWKNLLATVLPGAAYLAFLYFTGALPEALTQLSSQTNLREFGCNVYLFQQVYLFIPLGYAALRLLHGGEHAPQPPPRHTQRLAGIALVGAALAFALNRLWLNDLWVGSFKLFGVVLGAALYLFLERWRSRRTELQTCAAVLLLAWCLSLSIGYNTPVLGAGFLMVFLLGCAWPKLPARRGWRTALAVLAGVASAVTFAHVRTQFIYRDEPIPNLKYSLGGVFPGGRLLRTNEHTHAYLAELQAATKWVQSKGMRYAIMPDNAAWWVKSPQPNPLPVDWVQFTEVNSAHLVEWVKSTLTRERGKVMVIVQKIRADGLPGGYRIPIEGPRFEIALWVRQTFTKAADTKDFEIYQ